MRSVRSGRLITVVKAPNLPAAGLAPVKLSAGVKPPTPAQSSEITYGAVESTGVLLLYGVAESAPV